MNSHTMTKPSTTRLVAAALLAAVLLLSLFTGLRAASADDSTSTVSSVAMGGSVMLTGSGFTPAEKIVMWTTDPNGQALDAGYIFADDQGNFSLKVTSYDPNGLATTGNYTTLTDTYDGDGNLTAEYWETILKDGPAAGVWHVTAQGTVSNVLKVGNFTLAQS